MSRTLAAILGGSAAGLALVVIAVGLVWFYILHCKDLSNKNSETGSSDPPAPVTVEWNRGGRVSSAGSGPLSEPQGARRFMLEELEQATKSFSESNLVGKGNFGSVYKGLLCDGTIVAIKRRMGAPRKEFVEEVQLLSEIWHRNLVTLIGYCLEGGLQMLVYEYVPNGSITGHLYDNRHNQVARLEFKQRLSVALGAAKGLRHLHGLVPPLIHRNFKTSNVLVDENFIAKVADAGIVNLLQITECGSSQISRSDVFQDPEVGELGQLSEMSDVYSFGVFLLELVMGQEVTSLSSLESSGGLTQWVESHMNSNDIIDQRLGNSFTSEGMRGIIGLTLQCLDLCGRSRPKMDIVVSELDRVLETEMTLTTVMGDGTAIVTLGSQLFTSA